MNTVFVIMSNDFPAGVMDSEEAAMENVRERTIASKARCVADRSKQRVYWSYYKFTLNEVDEVE